MKKNYKISERDFRPLDNGSWRDHIVVDDKSLMVLLRIEQTMCFSSRVRYMSKVCISLSRSMTS